MNRDVIFAINALGEIAIKLAFVIAELQLSLERERKRERAKNEKPD
jgi:hypothetical protein